jgi:NAD(P)H-hydrate epimerase
VLTAAQARARDRFTIDVVGVPGLVLMEHAGRAVADLIEQRFPTGRVVVVCGGGNNGGDGFVCARHLLSRGRDVVVVTTAPSSSLRGDAATSSLLFDAAALALGRSALVCTARDASTLSEVAVVVDALFGIGLSRPLTGEVVDVVTQIATWRARGAAVVAVDVPSGLPTDGQRPGEVCVVADVTVTFGGRKIAHVAEAGVPVCGEVVDVDIGFVRPPNEAIDVHVLHAVQWPAADAAGHKNRFGHVGVVVGDHATRGAALLSARAALRSGAGLVTLLGTADLLRPDELMAKDLVDEGAFVGLTSVVVGPGMSRARVSQVRPWLQAAKAVAPGLLVVGDAGVFGVLQRGDADVWTPHPGEAATALGTTTAQVQADRVAAARALVALLGGVVVLKGAAPVVASSSSLIVVPGGSPALAVAGSGDVLAGTIAAVIAGARGAASVSTHVVAAVAAHQAAGAGQGRGLFASELADRLFRDG